MVSDKIIFKKKLEQKKNASALIRFRKILKQGFNVYENKML